MHHLFSQHYESWVQIPDPCAKYFIRVWQDGLYTGTHPEWSYCPMSIQTLAKMWKSFKSTSPKQDHGKPQRRALMSIARRRISDLEKAEFGALPQSNSESQWDTYFANLESSAVRYRAALIHALTAAVSTQHQDVPHAQIEKYSAEYAIDSMRIGYTARELYVRAGTGILDPAGLKSALPHSERVAGLLSHLSEPSPKEFIVATDLVSTEGAISRALGKKLAQAKLARVHDCAPGSHLADLDGRFVAVTRCYATHSVSAFQLHRSECKAILHHRLSLIRRKNINLSNSARVFLAHDPVGKGWKHTYQKTSITNHFHKLEHRLEADAFVEAMESSDDEPHVGIRIMCDALDRLAGKSWPDFCSQVYTAQLRRELRRRLVIGIRVAQERPMQRLPSPSWLQYVTEGEQSIDFRLLASEIRRDPIHSDELFAKRIDSVLNSSLSFTTQHDIRDFLKLAKGIRNLEVHSLVWPTHLQYVAAFLSKVMLVTFDLLSYERRRDA